MKTDIFEMYLKRLYPRSKYIAVVIQIDLKHMGEASVGSSTDTSEFLFYYLPMG